MNLVNVGYKSVNCYAVDTGSGYLLVDTGMPGTFREFLAVLKRSGVASGRIVWLVITHFHPDHCGTAQELISRGTVLVLADAQEPFLEQANRELARFPGFQPISGHHALVIPSGDRVAFRHGTGISGVLLHTPGHSDDSVTAVIDGLGAFTGDLRPPGQTEDAERKTAQESWKKIAETRPATVYPAHGPAFPMSAIGEDPYFR